MDENKQITISLDKDVIEYFKQQSQIYCMSYKKLINSFLKDGIQKNKKPKISWN